LREKARGRIRDDDERDEIVVGEPTGVDGGGGGRVTEFNIRWLIFLALPVLVWVNKAAKN
jgi:hypothetical protein